MVYFTIQKRERKIEVKINYEVDRAAHSWHRGHQFAGVAQPL